jgi:hypothetical protein
VGRLIITSPPYANNYDYADATRRNDVPWEINGCDLQSALHPPGPFLYPARRPSPPILGDPEGPLLVPISEADGDPREAGGRKENHGGKKQYHAMIAHYFLDLAKVGSASQIMRPGGRVLCRRRPALRIHVPVERWQARLAAGFKGFTSRRCALQYEVENRKHQFSSTRASVGGG